MEDTANALAPIFRIESTERSAPALPGGITLEGCPPMDSRKNTTSPYPGEVRERAGAKARVAIARMRRVTRHLARP